MPEFRVSARPADNSDPRRMGARMQGLPCFQSQTVEKGVQVVG